MGASTRLLILLGLHLWTPSACLSHAGARMPHGAHLALPAGAVRTSGPAPFRQRLGNYNDVQYYGSITLGGQHVDAIFDTGSFDVLVVSQRCDQCTNPQYNSNASSTYHSLDSMSQHVFGSGNTTSHVGIDEMRVGPFAVERQVIHEITKHEIKVLDKASFDAIVGIGAKMADAPCNVSLLCNLNISEFSICLERPAGSPGWLTWGSRLSDVEKTGAVELANIGKHHWAVSLKDVLPANAQLDERKRKAASVLLCGKGCAAIIDSGTSLIAGPSHSLQGLGALLPTLHEDCSNWNSLPDLEFSLNGRRMRLPKESYALKLSGTLQAKQAVSSFLHFKPQNLASFGEICFFGFITMDRSTEFGPLWIFGMPFFREYHVTFGLNDDATKRKMWLNRASATCEPEPVPNVAQNTTWKLTDANYKGVAMYPMVAVVQEDSDVIRGTPPRASEPLTVRAEDLLAGGGLRPRMEMWSSMTSL